MENNLIWKVYEDIPHNDKLTDNINLLIKEGYILIREDDIYILKEELQFYKREYEKSKL